MLKTIKKVILSALSILGISFLIWTFLLLNPKLAYANYTQFENVTIYHNQALESETEAVVLAAMELIKASDLYSSDASIDLCLNDGSFYPKLQPWIGGPLAYATLDKTIMLNGDPRFNENIVQTEWEINNFELRKFDLTNLLAHEFMHNLQFKNNLFYVVKSTLGKINWKLEGHAEYISRQYKNDGRLKEKIQHYIEELDLHHNGIPVIELENGTKQNLMYYKYAIIIQYLMEIELLDFESICNDKRDLEGIYNEMVSWSIDE